MAKKNDKIETAAEKFIKELTRLVRSFKNTFLTIPKNMKERNFYLLNTGMWMLFILGLIYIKSI